MTAVAASTNSEELILELFDVLERCPASARDAATDAALEAIAKAGAPEAPEEPEVVRPVALEPEKASSALTTPLPRKVVEKRSSSSKKKGLVDILEQANQQRGQQQQLKTSTFKVPKEPPFQLRTS